MQWLLLLIPLILNLHSPCPFLPLLTTIPSLFDNIKHWMGYGPIKLRSVTLLYFNSNASKVAMLRVFLLKLCFWKVVINGGYAIYLARKQGSCYNYVPSELLIKIQGKMHSSRGYSGCATFKKDPMEDTIQNKRTNYQACCNTFTS